MTPWLMVALVADEPIPFFSLRDTSCSLPLGQQSVECLRTNLLLHANYRQPVSDELQGGFQYVTLSVIDFTGWWPSTIHSIHTFPCLWKVACL